MRIANSREHDAKRGNVGSALCLLGRALADVLSFGSAALSDVLGTNKIASFSYFFFLIFGKAFSETLQVSGLCKESAA